MVQVLHLIPRVVQGGAELLLRDYVSSRRPGIDHSVAVLFEDSDQDLVQTIDCRVEQFSSRSYWDLVKNLPRLRSWVRAAEPDLVVTWLYHASALAPVLVSGKTPVLMYLHNTDLASSAKRAERVAQRLVGRTARLRNMSLLYSGEVSRRYHEDHLHYPGLRASSLDNGVSLDRFAPDPHSRQRTRHELGMGKDEFVFGAFGRFNAQKNWPLILDSMALVKERTGSAKLIAAGRGVHTANPEFMSLVTSRGLLDNVVALGNRSDMPALFNAVDVLLMASGYGEALPLVMIEALTSGKPVMARGIGSIPEALDGLLECIDVTRPDDFMTTVLAAANGTWEGLKVQPEALRQRAVDRYGLDRYRRDLDQLIVQKARDAGR